MAFQRLILFKRCRHLLVLIHYHLSASYSVHSTKHWHHDIGVATYHCLRLLLGPSLTTLSLRLVLYGYPVAREAQGILRSPHGGRNFAREIRNDHCRDHAYDVHYRAEARILLNLLLDRVRRSESPSIPRHTILLSMPEALVSCLISFFSFEYMIMLVVESFPRG
jgi:hypothetical protein